MEMHHVGEAMDVCSPVVKLEGTGNASSRECMAAGQKGKKKKKKEERIKAIIDHMAILSLCLHCTL